MAFVRRNVHDDPFLRNFGRHLLPATLGESLEAAAEDPRLRPTDEAGAFLGVAREDIEFAARALRLAGRIPGIPGATDLAETLEENASVIGTPFLSAEEANDRFGQFGLRFDEPVRLGVAEALSQVAREEMLREDVLARGPRGIGAQLLQLGAGFFAAATDPLNIAASFVPVLGQARWAGLIARYGRTGGSFVGGAIQGAVGNALVEPAVFGLSRQLQLDYEMSDALINVTFGGLLGGGLHVATGAFGARLRRAGQDATPPQIAALSPEAREAALRTAVAQAVHGADVNVGPLFRSQGVDLRASTALSGGALARGADGTPRFSETTIEVGDQRVELSGRALAEAEALTPDAVAVREEIAKAETRVAELEARLAEPDSPAVAAEARLGELDEQIAATTDGRRLRRLRRERDEVTRRVQDELGGRARAASRRSLRTRDRNELTRLERELTELRGREASLTAPPQPQRAARPARTAELEEVFGRPGSPARAALEPPTRTDEQQILDAIARAENQLRVGRERTEPLADLDEDLASLQSMVDAIEDLTPAERAQLDEAAEIEASAGRYGRGAREAAFCLGRNL